jgi:hypothetical protein
MKRTRAAAAAENVHLSAGLPGLSRDARLILTLSPLDLIDGWARRVVVWDPDRCAPLMRAKMQEILNGPTRHSEMDLPAIEAQRFFWGGLGKVKDRSLLDPAFLRLSRAELGLVAFPVSCIRCECVDDDSSSSGEEEEEEESDASSDEQDNAEM